MTFKECLEKFECNPVLNAIHYKWSHLVTEALSLPAKHTKFQQKRPKLDIILIYSPSSKIWAIAVEGQKGWEEGFYLGYEHIETMVGIMLQSGIRVAPATVARIEHIFSLNWEAQ